MTRTGKALVAGAALVTGFLQRGAAILAALLSVMFLFVIGWAHFQNLDIACGCFGPLSPALESGWRTAILDVAMLAGSVVSGWNGGVQQNCCTQRQP